MTVEEYLSFVYDLKGCKLNRVKHLEEICEVTRISDVSHRLIKNLSKGYRQRVGIAQALVGNPQVMIFDEPTVGLDPKQVIEVRNLIRTLGRDHTIILSTHILQEVQAVCDRIIIINKGKIVADEKTENINRAVQSNRRFNIKICGPQREVLSLLREKQGVVYAEALGERDGEAYVYAVESAPNVDIRKSLFFALAEKGWAIIGLEAVGMSIEDIFISIVDKVSDGTTKTKYDTRKRRSKTVTRNSMEQSIAESIIENTAAKQEAEEKTEEKKGD
jgi:ABC-2 type transport system ATP-binding protein